MCTRTWNDPPQGSAEISIIWVTHFRNHTKQADAGCRMEHISNKIHPHFHWFYKLSLIFGPKGYISVEFSSLIINCSWTSSLTSQVKRVSFLAIADMTQWSQKHSMDVVIFTPFHSNMLFYYPTYNITYSPLAAQELQWKNKCTASPPCQVPRIFQFQLLKSVGSQWQLLQ